MWRHLSILGLSDLKHHTMQQIIYQGISTRYIELNCMATYVINVRYLYAMPPPPLVPKNSCPYIRLEMNSINTVLCMNGTDGPR